MSVWITIQLSVGELSKSGPTEPGLLWFGQGSCTWRSWFWLGTIWMIVMSFKCDDGRRCLHNAHSAISTDNSPTLSCMVGKPLFVFSHKSRVRCNEFLYTSQSRQHPKNISIKTDNPRWRIPRWRTVPPCTVMRVPFLAVSLVLISDSDYYGLFRVFKGH